MSAAIGPLARAAEWQQATFAHTWAPSKQPRLKAVVAGDRGRAVVKDERQRPPASASALSLSHTEEEGVASRTLPLGTATQGEGQKARKRAKDRLRRLTSRRWGVSMERRIAEINRFTDGWTAYYRLADTPWPFEELDKWLRRRLRQVRWKEWKRPRTRRRNLRALDINELNARQWASSRKGYWRIAGSWVLCYALPNAYWTNLGLKGFTETYRRFRDAERTARCGPARRVVWGASG